MVGEPDRLITKQVSDTKCFFILTWWIVIKSSSLLTSHLADFEIRLGSLTFEQLHTNFVDGSSSGAKIK